MYSEIYTYKYMYLLIHTCSISCKRDMNLKKNKEKYMRRIGG